MVNLRNVPPSPSFSNMLDAALANSKQHSKLKAGKIGVTNRNHIRFGQLHTWGIFSAWVFLSSLQNHVLSVFFFRSEEKMRWSYTGRIIAFVKNAFRIRNWSKMQNPTGTARNDVASISFPFSDYSVSKGNSGTNPQPAIVRNFNFRPKSFNECFGKSLRDEELGLIVRPLDQVHFDWVTLRAVTGRAGAILVNSELPLLIQY